MLHRDGVGKSYLKLIEACEDERLRVQKSIDFLNDQYLDANYKEIKVTDHH